MFISYILNKHYLRSHDTKIFFSVTLLTFAGHWQKFRFTTSLANNEAPTQRKENSLSTKINPALYNVLDNDQIWLKVPIIWTKLKETLNSFNLPSAIVVTSCSPTCKDE